jgi:serine/tyrosine/threonine adenylyltransferase
MSSQPQQQPIGLSELTFDNRFVAELPADPQPTNERRQITDACYSHVLPATVAAPTLVAYAREVAELLDLDEADCESSEFAQIFTGNQQLPGMHPYATCYGGHQFGNWAGQLGDGRAINLGEVVNRSGQRWALQLKGAGPTPYSRTADGLAVLRSSLREFLCSEAMYHLGVPTTRALSLTLTGEQVLRDMFYDGNARHEPGAVVCRVAPSFTRFGHFQMLAARGETDLLRQFLEYTMRTDFSGFELAEDASDSERKAAYCAWFAHVCELTADMVIGWMRVGFVHGVMNTDNMSVLGLTIDYGPYGWLENYDPDWTPNTTDAQGRRYRFGQQPHIAMWNLVQLANAIYPLVEDTAPFEQALDGYGHRYESGWADMVTSKLGLRAFEGDADKALADDLFTLLASVETDMTIFFRQLGEFDIANYRAAAGEVPSALRPAYYVETQLDDDFCSRLQGWLSRYQARVQRDGQSHTQRCIQMHAVNPRYVLRNYIAQLAIDEAENGDFSRVAELLDVLRRPYDDQPEHDQYYALRPDWARQRAGCSMLSCSS